MSQIGRSPFGDDAAGIPGTPDRQGARWFRRHLAAAVAVVLCRAEGSFRGTTVTSCVFLSADPMLLLIALDGEGQMPGWIAADGGFTVSVMSWDAQFLVDRFAGLGPRPSARLQDVPHTVLSSGRPVLDASLVWADCRLEQTWPAGDHVALIGRVTMLGGDATDDPLLAFDGRYLRPG